jgi:AcrR family transcriptional regulator
MGVSTKIGLEVLRHGVCGEKRVKLVYSVLNQTKGHYKGHSQINFVLDKTFDMNKIKTNVRSYFGDGMKKEKQTKGEVTRLAVENAAISLFLEQGYHATSMRQIAERAELALGGIYNHFASKDEIFEAIIVDQHPYKKILPLITAVEGDTAQEFFSNAFRIVVIELGKQPEFINLMFIELVEFKGKHGSIMLREIAPKVLPVFEKLVKNMKGLRYKNPAVLMRSFFGAIISYFTTEMIISNSVISNLLPKNSTDIYIDIFLNGVVKESA